MSAPQPASHEPSGPDETPQTPTSGPAPLPDRASPLSRVATPPAAPKPRAQRRKVTAWPSPVPQVDPSQVTAPPAAPATASQPATEPPSTALPSATPTAPAAPPTAQAATAPAPLPPLPPLKGKPISLAGADIPAMLLPQQPSAKTARVVNPPSRAPQEPSSPPQPVEPIAALAPTPRVVVHPVATAPTASTPPPGVPAASAPAPGALHDPSSKAPPGFSGAHIVAAESPTLVALDPAPDETTAPPAPAAPVETIGGSALLAKAVGLARHRPRRDDLRAFGRDRAATARVGAAAVVAFLLLLALVPVLAGVLGGVPVLSTMIAQLESFTLLPGAYGLPVFVTGFGAVTAAGVVVAQMEKSAHQRGTRSDPTTRLNIALAGLLALAIAGALLALGRSTGSLSAGASVALFLATCLAIPLGNLPGGRAMAYQPARAWALLAALAVGGTVIQPSFATLAIAVVALLRVRSSWAAITGRDDDFIEGPVDHTNRLSALIIVAFVVIAGSAGMRATTIPPVQMKNGGAPLIDTTELPGAEQGPVVAPPDLP